MDWKTLLAYITGSVDQHLLLRNEYLVTENCMLRHQIKGRVRLSHSERKALAAIGQKLGKKALEASSNTTSMRLPECFDQTGRNLYHDPTRAIPCGAFGAIT